MSLSKSNRVIIEAVAYHPIILLSEGQHNSGQAAERLFISTSTHKAPILPYVPHSTSVFSYTFFS
jgi:hypothetical protein